MAHLVFARKFRPQTFEEVVSQDVIVTTLKNSIIKNRIAQSFLFTGSRGVGKTSTARIFAKALNCEKGPSPEPCNKCVTCEEITQGTSLDILEIDGASNRGIDEIRNLREGVKFKPTRGQHKVYIIDEVHMLTGEAFNALLKTLEEPPPHVKFIFATTEAHKVPLTILSRCQRFNFKRIATDEIAKKLKEVAKKEKIKIGDSALYLIAKHSEGSLRDGEGLLDQLSSFGEEKIQEADVAFALGLAGDDLYRSLLDAIKARDGSKVLKIVANLNDEGKDLSQFSKGLLEWFRDLLVSQVGGIDEGLVEGTDDHLKALAQFKDAFSRDELLFSVTLLQQLIRDVRWSQTARFLIETCLLKIVHRADLRPIDEVIGALKSVERSAPLPPSRTTPPKKKDNLTGQILGETAGMLNRASSVKLEKPTRPRPQAAVAKEEYSSPRPTLSTKLDDVTLDQVEGVWPDLLERVKSIKMSCGTFLAEGEPVDAMDGIVVVGFEDEFKFHKEALEKQDNKELIRSHLNSLLEKNVAVSFVVTKAETRIAAKPKDEPRDPKDQDIITSALDVFDGSHIIRRE